MGEIADGEGTASTHGREDPRGSRETHEMEGNAKGNGDAGASNAEASGSDGQIRSCDGGS